MIDQFIDYYGKAKKMQELKFQNGTWTKQDVNDDLVWNIPIYDVVNRRYAAFSSLLEAIIEKENDPKGNGVYFKHLDLDKDSFIFLCYLFRLCGSGINYIPKQNEPWGTHGFGNFFIIDLLRDGIIDPKYWIYGIPDKKFCDVKGYLLPMIKGGLKKFIEKESYYFINYLIDYVNIGGIKSIKDVVDKGNDWLLSNNYKRQNFVLTAFAMDLAEYYPKLVDQDSDVYIGSNASKCLKMILPNMKKDKALRYLCDITGGFSKPYDMEDVACDFIRYIGNFQSSDHIKYNNGIKYYNNVLK
tara:strand:+ start:1390 stop:2286 length:897 start_codon:yes stop_codon:yes gene_type:complete